MTQLARLVNMEEPQCVIDEVKLIISMINPEFDYKHFDRTYLDVLRLFHGDYPGYRECNTQYHDLRHTMSVLLAMVRLMHGYAVGENYSFTEKELNIGLVSALMHDTGYHQNADDTVGTGAKHTIIHIQRSIDFVNQYYVNDEYFHDTQNLFRDILNCTGLVYRIPEIEFATPRIKLLGMFLGTADLLGQMADRHYLEKLLFLFHEFQEANIKTFESELDLLRRTISFCDLTKKRFAFELGGVNLYMVYHFRKRWNIEEDLYAISIDKNVQYINFVLKNDEMKYRQRFRRGGLTKKLENMN